MHDEHLRINRESGSIDAKRARASKRARQWHQASAWCTMNGIKSIWMTSTSKGARAPYYTVCTKESFSLFRFFAFKCNRTNEWGVWENMRVQWARAHTRVPSRSMMWWPLTEQKLEPNFVVVLIVWIAQLNGHVEGVAAPYDQWWISPLEDVILDRTMLFCVFALKQFHSNHIVGICACGQGERKKKMASEWNAIKMCIATVTN